MPSLAYFENSVWWFERDATIIPEHLNIWLPVGSPVWGRFRTHKPARESVWDLALRFQKLFAFSSSFYTSCLCFEMRYFSWFFSFLLPLLCSVIMDYYFFETIRQTTLKVGSLITVFYHKYREPKTSISIT